MRSVRAVLLVLAERAALSFISQNNFDSVTEMYYYFFLLARRTLTKTIGEKIPFLPTLDSRGRGRGAEASFFGLTNQPGCGAGQARTAEQRMLCPATATAMLSRTRQ